MTQASRLPRHVDVGLNYWYIEARPRFSHKLPQGGRSTYKRGVPGATALETFFEV